MKQKIAAATVSHPKKLYVTINGFSISRGSKSTVYKRVTPKNRHLPNPSKTYYKNFQVKIF